MIALLVAAPARAAGKRQLEGVVNLNTASLEELQLLPGVGPAKVRNIVAYRTKHPFRTVEELVRIKGIGRKMVRQLRLHLAVSGPTTAQQVIRAAPDPAATSPPEPPPAMLRRLPAAPSLGVAASGGVRGARGTRSPPFPRSAANHCRRQP
jgi:competence protein ComEA